MMKHYIESNRQVSDERGATRQGARINRETSGQTRLERSRSMGIQEKVWKGIKATTRPLSREIQPRIILKRSEGAESRL